MSGKNEKAKRKAQEVQAPMPAPDQLRVEVGHGEGVVMIRYSLPVTTLTMNPNQARTLARELDKRADMATQAKHAGLILPPGVE